MEYDHVIVGGGIYGTYVAWELAKKGEEVALFEANKIGAGASGGVGKRGIRANGRSPYELPLMKSSYQIWPSLEKQLKTTIGFEQIGQLQLIERTTPEINPTSMKAAPAQVNLQKNHDISTKLLSAEETREREPGLSDEIEGSIYTPNDGIVDHTATTEALAEAARRAGATIYEEEPVRGVSQKGNIVESVNTSDGRSVSVGDMLLLLNNAAGVTFLKKQFDIELPIWNFCPQVIVTETPDDLSLNHLIGHSHRLLAMKEIDSDQLMITGGWPANWNNTTNNGTIIDDKVASNLEQASAVFPSVENVEIREVYASHRETSSIDHLPVIDQFPKIENMIVATGWTGHGFAIAPAVSQLIADWVYLKSRPELLKPFSASRYY